AKANREKAIAIIKAEEDAQKSRIAAEREAYKLKLEAETRAAAVKAQAEGVAKSQQLQAEAEANVVRTAAQADADRVRIMAEARATSAAQDAAAITKMAEAAQRKGEAEAEAKRRLVEAENAVSTKFLLRDVAMKALDVLPAVTAELMSPAKAISEIKVLQLQGTAMNGGSNGDGANGHSGPFGAALPILKTIMEAGAAYPLLREMMAFTQTDTEKLTGLAKSFLSTLPAEIRSIVEKDPSIAEKLEEVARRQGQANLDIEVHSAPPTPRQGAPLGGE
ncbi:MAG TPA: flotillin domain-containing protein, partial [Polyangiaceae bacterium]|nr:flotillin domain-containing protein [Polyangiaceae bacterium]